MKDWTNIISFTYPHEANLAKSLLEASDIKVILKDELTIQVDNFLSNAIGGVKVFVENDKTEEALLLLENVGYIEKNQSKKKEKTGIFSYEYRDYCPYCGGVNIIRKNTPGYIFALSILFLNFPFPFLKRRYHCYDCSEGWKIRKGEPIS